MSLTNDDFDRIADIVEDKIAPVVQRATDNKGRLNNHSGRLIAAETSITTFKTDKKWALKVGAWASFLVTIIVNALVFSIKFIFFGKD